MTANSARCASSRSEAILSFNYMLVTIQLFCKGIRSMGTLWLEDVILSAVEPQITTRSGVHPTQALISQMKPRPQRHKHLSPAPLPSTTQVLFWGVSLCFIKPFPCLKEYGQVFQPRNESQTGFLTFPPYIIPGKDFYLTAKHLSNQHNPRNRFLLCLPFPLFALFFKAPLKYHNSIFKVSAKKHHDTVSVQSYNAGSCIQECRPVSPALSTQAGLIGLYLTDQCHPVFCGLQATCLCQVPLPQTAAKSLLQGRVCECTCLTWHDG